MRFMLQTYHTWDGVLVNVCYNQHRSICALGQIYFTEYQSSCISCMISVYVTVDGCFTCYRSSPLLTIITTFLIISYASVGGRIKILVMHLSVVLHVIVFIMYQSSAMVAISVPFLSDLLDSLDRVTLRCCQSINL